MQHVRVGENRCGMPACPLTSILWRVAVVGHGRETGRAETAERPQLILREGLRGKQQKACGRALRLQGVPCDRELIATRLARRGAGRNHHGTSGTDILDRLDLMCPQALAQSRQDRRDR